MRETKRFMATLLVAVLLVGCGEKTDTPKKSDGVLEWDEIKEQEIKIDEKSKENKEVMEYLYSDLLEIKEKFWDLWLEETGKLSEVEYYGTSGDEEEQNEHYLKIATEITNKIAEENKDIPVGGKVIVTGYIESASELDENGFFVRHGGGTILFFLKHNARDDGYNKFSCKTNDEKFLELKNNTPVKIEATFLKPDIIGSNNDLYDCKIIEYEEAKEAEKNPSKTEIEDGGDFGIDGFQNANIDYEKFNSYASENGLGGTLVYVDGKVLSQTLLSNEDPENPVLFLVIEQDDGNRWCISINSDKELNGINEKNVRVFGMYLGFSDVFNAPAIGVLIEENGREEDARVEVENGSRYETIWTFSNYISEKINDFDSKAKQNEEHDGSVELSTGKYIVGEDISSGKYDIVGVSKGNIRVCSQGKDYGDVLIESITPGEVVYANVRLEDGYMVELVLDGKVQLQPK